MTFAHSPAAPGAVGSAKTPSITRINAVPIAILALLGTAALAIATFSFGNSIERALAIRLNEVTAQVRSLSAQARSLEETVQAKEQKANQPDALKVLEVKQAQTEALVAILVKDIEALRSLKTPASPAKESRSTAKALKAPASPPSAKESQTKAKAAH